MSSALAGSVIAFSDEQMQIMKHCAQECVYQRSGEMSVFWMLNAWRYAQSLSGTPPTLENCKTLGRLVEPVKNKNGLRLVGVRVGYDVKMPPQHVPAAIQNLFEVGVGSLEPAEFFREYEEIHPFVDGNGRTGNILYNWLNETLDDPLMPPEFWGAGHRIVGRV